MNDSSIRYVLALGDDADRVETADGVAVIERLPSVVLVEADEIIAKELASYGDYVHIYVSPHDALRALTLFRRPGPG
jgi:predicted NAD/FAD-binding protein